MLPARDPRSRAGSPVLNLAVVIALVAAAVVTFPALRPSQAGGGSPLLSADPPGLTSAIEADVPVGSNLFVAQALASWFEFAVPHDRVFVDSRIELYPQKIWSTYLDAASGKLGWQDTMDRYDVQAMVLTTAQTAEA